MTDGLDQVIEDLRQQLSGRLNITSELFARFVGGSPDVVFEELIRQINTLLDEHDTAITNAFEELIQYIRTQQLEEPRSGEDDTNLRKGEYLPEHSR